MSITELLKAEAERKKSEQNMSPSEKLDALKNALTAMQKRMNEISNQLEDIAKEISPPTPESNFSFYSKIEETFNQRRGKYKFFSPVEWALMEDWDKQGIPIDLVLSEINKAFNQAIKAQNPGRVKSLTYCKNAIEEAFLRFKSGDISK